MKESKKGIKVIIVNSIWFSVLQFKSKLKYIDYRKRSVKTFVINQHSSYKHVFSGEC